MRILMFAVLLLTAHQGFAQVKAITEEGKEVVLYANGTWKFIEEPVIIEEEGDTIVAGVFHISQIWNTLFLHPFLLNLIPNQSAMADKKIHHGRNVKRFREMLGIKQETLALELGDDWTQKKISLLEAKEEIEPALLQQVATVLKVPAEAIENFDEQAAINIISNSFHDEASAYSMNYKCNFNPIDKVVELYERMLKEKDETILQLKLIVESKK